MSRTRGLLLLCSLVLVSCGPPVYPVVDREPGVRAPVSGACDALDPVRCLLPWPSSSFLVADPSTETGVRVDVSLDTVNRMDDPGEFFLHSNGFSRVTSILTAFEGEVTAEGLGGPTGGTLRLFVASPDSPHYGEEVALRLEVDVEYSAREMAYTSVLIGDPLEILEPNTEYVAIVTDAVRGTDGTTYEAPHVERVALGLDLPATEEEAAIAGYHAPTRTLIEHLGLDPEHLVRVWDFITRTDDDAMAPLLSMREQALAALEAGDVSVVIDTVEQVADGPVATIVVGHLSGLPNWLDADGMLVRGPDGLPVVMGTTDARFRVVIPRGVGDYRTVLYGHGAGGTVFDSSFDSDLAESGIAKVNVEFLGWTDGPIVDTLASVSRAILEGAAGALAPLMQSVAHVVVIDREITTGISDAVSAATLGGMPNPHEGRHPGLDGPIWVGGSLGGTMGLVITSIDDRLDTAVLNVPGAAWSHWVRDSLLFNLFIAPLRNRNGGEVNVATLAAMAQTLFDYVDGATFSHLAVADGDIFLAQESMGDPVLPNAGNEFVGIALGATQVGAVLSPIHGLAEEATEVVGRSGFTQFRVASSGGTFDVHGFAADQNTTAGQAAFEQIRLFLTTTWDTGSPVIRVPTLCPGGSCDFAPEGG